MPTKFLNILPDPDYGIDSAGFSGSTLGQGFVSAAVSNEQKNLLDRTISGKGIPELIL